MISFLVKTLLHHYSIIAMASLNINDLVSRNELKKKKRMFVFDISPAIHPPSSASPMPSVIGTRVSTPEVSDTTSRRRTCSRGTEFNGQARVQSQKKEDRLKESINLVYGRGTFRQMINDSIEAGMI